MDLDNQKQIKELDKGFVAESISALPEQISHLIEQAQEFSSPISQEEIDSIVLNGMGGSNLGIRLINSVMKDKLTVPILIEPGYEVPNYVGEKTLYIICSYSGTTEEPISTYEEAKRRGAKIILFSSDNQKSKLKEIAKKDNIPCFLFDPKFNPSNQPRMGLGYSVFSIIVTLNKMGFFDIEESEIEDTIKLLKEENERYIPEINLDNNLAKQIASTISGKIPTYITSEFLNGNGHIMRNQTNENGKHFAFMLDTPELNHYSMEGLAHPKKNTENLIFLIFNSELYHPRVQKRNQLTEKIIKENGIEVISHKLVGKTKLIQAMEMLQLGTWTTYYLGILNEVDPVKIPWVDMFKTELG